MHQTLFCRWFLPFDKKLLRNPRDRCHTRCEKMLLPLAFGGGGAFSGNSRLISMKKKTASRQLVWTAVTASALLFATGNAFGLGSDYPNDKPVKAAHLWLKGMEKLVNTTNRVHGFSTNWMHGSFQIIEDVFFFSGNATNLTAFLQDYSQIKCIEKHRLILHEGVGEAKSPWEKTGRPCDWKLYGSPKDYHRSGDNREGPIFMESSGYFLEVHFWTGGQIRLDQVTIPQKVEVKKDK